VLIEPETLHPREVPTACGDVRVMAVAGNDETCVEAQAPRANVSMTSPSPAALQAKI
jgi:hypothetical protein